MSETKDVLVETAIAGLKEGKRVAIVVRGRDKSIEVKELHAYLDRPGTVVCSTSSEWEWTIDISAIDAVVMR